MKKLRDVTLNDVEDLLDMEGTPFDVLVATAARAKDIHELENQPETRPPPPPKTEKRRSAASNKRNLAKKKKQINLPKKKRKSEQPPALPPPQPLPEEFKSAIEEITMEPAKLVIEKALTRTDVSDIQCRLLIPMKKMREEFLTEEEKRFLRGYDGEHKNHKNHKAVKIFEPSLATETVRVCQWDMKTSSNYVLNGNWMDIVERNELRKGMVLQVWSFRVNGDLGLALVRPPTN